ncbi:monocarboxylate transporter 9-like [Folsomia candida]|uniref:monocarboxylate transporter 9-like n=1 Tax=Folsomia candida TaxID=158441 RepID=UPI001604D6C2|nr:monocarboxylate transporter 9-like [Folsomia candida]
MSNFLLYMWYEIPLTFLADTATGLGYSEGEGAMLGSTIGLLTVFGNIILGYLGDKKWANSVTIYGLCISICGIVTGLMPCLFGKLFSMGLTYYFLVLLCACLVVSLEKFTPAYGLLLLVQGIGNLIGPPIAGLLYDYTGKYAWSFWIAGVGSSSPIFHPRPNLSTPSSPVRRVDSGHFRQSQQWTQQQQL